MVKISIPTSVFEPNFISVNESVGKAIYEKISDDSLDDTLVNPNFTQDEKSLIVYSNEKKIFIVHAIRKIVNDENLAYIISPAFKVDKDFFKIFKQRFPELSSL